MRNERKKQVMTLSILLVAVLVISIGFAAFSATLRINTDVTVNPNASDFKVVFSSSENTLETNAVKASPENMGSDATIDNSTVPTISGLSANFTSPGDTVTYTFYVRNEGEYEAFLNSISFRGKNCTAGEGTSVALVNNACNSITTTVNVGSITTNETLTNITGESLTPNQSKQVTVTISYAQNGSRADGPFRVEFGDISMYYATVNGMNEEVEKICQLTNDVNGNKQVDLGDEVTCGSESFYVIPNDSTSHPTATEGNVTLITKYNLNVGADAPSGTQGIQNANATGMVYDSEGNFDYESCNFTEEEEIALWGNDGATVQEFLDFYKQGNGCNGTIPFTETKYWGEVANGTFIYNSQSLLYPHVENYKTYIQNLGVDVKEASLMSFSQVLELLLIDDNTGDIEFLIKNFNFTGFWLGSANSDGSYDDFVYLWQSDGNPNGISYFNGYLCGVRPIIVIPLTEVEI